MGLPKEWKLLLSLATLLVGANGAENETFNESNHHSKGNDFRFSQVLLEPL